RGLGREEAEELAGVALDSGGLFYPEAGWVHPPALCAHLAAHPNIRLLTHREVLDLHREDGQWCARAGETLLARAPVAVLAGGAEIARFPEAAGLPLKRIRGQISRLPATAASRDLQTVLCAEGYVAPVRDG
ncbi:FAD-dependent oxidoreductase, partial [Azotobacter chroococcum]|nr:FAD-dependent oxidoreductase [Azotobacter chroococcum]